MLIEVTFSGCRPRITTPLNRKELQRIWEVSTCFLGRKYEKRKEPRDILDALDSSVIFSPHSHFNFNQKITATKYQDFRHFHN